MLPMTFQKVKSTKLYVDGQAPLEKLRLAAFSRSQLPICSCCFSFAMSKSAYSATSFSLSPVFGGLGPIFCDASF